MTRFAAAVALGALLGAASPALAEPAPGEDDKRVLPDFEALEREAQTAVIELLAVIGPLVERLSLFMEDLPAYEAPVMLPNGDILIRRKAERPALPAPEAPGDTETEI